jgi:heme/copper-type cytochrome/quinol oxidase subunit 2
MIDVIKKFGERMIERLLGQALSGQKNHGWASPLSAVAMQEVDKHTCCRCFVVVVVPVAVD